MRDYIRQLMKEAHEKGTPVMRTLFYEFPDDPMAWETEDEYMFGSSYLVAPILTKGAVSRNVYLPSGANWRERHNGTEYVGGCVVCADAPLNVIPVFERVPDPVSFAL